jgi:Ca2+-binding EF-hand superfamily protein
MANVKVMKTLKTVALSMTPNEAKFLGKVFKKVDKDNDGRIQASDIDRVIAEGTFHYGVYVIKYVQKKSHLINFFFF